ncbi:scarecrow-like protein 14 [Rhododendron vialii]|uniref:scarecrow-like protein 14 n=1 Tax=Rhododendron vialii TaxID=182163 RepID=UPI00265EF580|nr:scarecrow-like protein 14 [Rhododendron vialii]
MEGFTYLNDEYEFNPNLGSSYSDHHEFDLPYPVSDHGIGDIPFLNGFDEEEENDFSDAVLKYINQVLMEDDDDDDVEDKSTLHVAEKSLYNVLVNRNENHPSPSQPLYPHHDASVSFSTSNFSLLSGGGVEETKRVILGSDYEIVDFDNNQLADHEGKKKVLEGKKELGDLMRGRKSHHHDDEDDLEGRSNKQLAVSAEESVLHELFDRVLFFDAEEDESSLNSIDGYGGGTKKRVSKKEAVDMRSLLIECMNSIASSDHKRADELLKQIGKRSSPSGNSSQRLAHCFANALEARLAGTGNMIYKELAAKNVITSDALRAYKMYMSTFPFLKTSNYFVTQTSLKIAEKATTLHYIHFEIMHGIQLPPLIQSLSRRPGGPPKLRVTAIDFPQPGFRPAAVAEETGHRLENYCKRLNVPFEYNFIVRKWETIRLEELKLQKDEVVVVNSFYKFHSLLDDTILENSPRDAVLDLIKRIRPDVFIHGVGNGGFNSPFFDSRFREALFYFSALFEMFEACVPRENPERMKFETDIYGKEIMNVIACEGLERVERPETYKQWHVRTLRAGFRQLPLNQEITKKIKAKVKSSYNKNFLVDEASDWMLQGWKGRVIFALSCWKAA